MAGSIRFRILFIFRHFDPKAFCFLIILYNSFFTASSVFGQFLKKFWPPLLQHLRFERGGSHPPVAVSQSHTSFLPLPLKCTMNGFWKMDKFSLNVLLPFFEKTLWPFTLAWSEGMSISAAEAVLRTSWTISVCAEAPRLNALKSSWNSASNCSPVISFMREFNCGGFTCPIPCLEALNGFVFVSSTFSEVCRVQT